MEEILPLVPIFVVLLEKNGSDKCRVCFINDSADFSETRAGCYSIFKTAKHLLSSWALCSTLHFWDEKPILNITIILLSF